MPGVPSPGLGTLLQSGASPSSGSSAGSSPELRKSGSAGASGNMQEGLQQMNTRSRGERTVGIIAGIEVALYEKDLERRIERGSPWCTYHTGGKGMTHLCLYRCWRSNPGLLSEVTLPPSHFPSP